MEENRSIKMENTTTADSDKKKSLFPSKNQKERDIQRQRHHTDRDDREQSVKDLSDSGCTAGDNLVGLKQPVYSDCVDGTNQYNDNPIAKEKQYLFFHYAISLHTLFSDFRAIIVKCVYTVLCCGCSTYPSG